MFDNSFCVNTPVIAYLKLKVMSPKIVMGRDMHLDSTVEHFTQIYAINLNNLKSITGKYSKRLRNNKL